MATYGTWPLTWTAKSQHRTNNLTELTSRYVSPAHPLYISHSINQNTFTQCCMPWKNQTSCILHFAILWHSWAAVETTKNILMYLLICNIYFEQFNKQCDRINVHDVAYRLFLFLWCSWLHRLLKCMMIASRFFLLAAYLPSLVQFLWLYTVSQKSPTFLFSISLLNFNRFSKFFADAFCKQLAINWLLNILSHIDRDACYTIS